MIENYVSPSHWIYVPLSPEAEENDENDCTYKDSHEEEFYREIIMGKKSIFYFDAYRIFNRKLDLLIDSYEEEKIPFEKLEPAKQIAESIMQQQTDEEKREWTQHLINIIQKAIDCKTCVWIEG